MKNGENIWIEEIKCVHLRKIEGRMSATGFQQSRLSDYSRAFISDWFSNGFIPIHYNKDWDELAEPRVEFPPQVLYLSITTRIET